MFPSRRHSRQTEFGVQVRFYCPIEVDGPKVAGAKPLHCRMIAPRRRKPQTWEDRMADDFDFCLPQVTVPHTGFAESLLRRIEGDV